MPFPEPPHETISSELLCRLRNGDRGAFDRLYARHRDELLLSVRAGMGPRLRAAMQSDDVLQSVAIEAFEVLRDERRPQPQGFLPLLRRIVRHRLVDRARALGRRQRAGEVAMTEDLQQTLQCSPPTYEDPRYERLERALLQLPVEMREVLRLRRFEGLCSADVAARLGRTDDAVRKLHSRTMAKLARLLQDAP